MSITFEVTPLHWDESRKCFLSEKYLQLVYLQPSNFCEVHEEDLEKCNPAYWLREDLTDKEAAEEDSFRIDSETGDCMGCGWYWNTLAFYIKDEQRAEALCQRVWGQTITEAYNELEEMVEYGEIDCNEEFYWTQWD